MNSPSSQPQVVTTVRQLRETLAPARQSGKRIGVVPTMGALHEGHLSLVRASQAECQTTVVTIFVNPTQFGPKEDFSKYPRTLDKDLAALATCGPALVFAPTVEEMYPAGFSSWVEVGAVSEPLEGACRPGHFRGVATVVMKLFQMVGADVAYFGQKDYQQTLVIRRMVRDLDVPIEIKVCPTVREADGLAMSSRNAYLDPQARRRALVLWKSLDLAQTLVNQGQRDAGAIRAAMEKQILTAEDAQIEYIALADPETLAPVDEIRQRAVALLAVRIGGTRLIDNLILEP
jgi:pantoate--beta-alanine ligase